MHSTFPRLNYRSSPSPNHCLLFLLNRFIFLAAVLQTSHFCLLLSLLLLLLLLLLLFHLFIDFLFGLALSLLGYWELLAPGLRCIVRASQKKWKLWQPEAEDRNLASSHFRSHWETRTESTPTQNIISVNISF